MTRVTTSRHRNEFKEPHLNAALRKFNHAVASTKVPGGHDSASVMECERAAVAIVEAKPENISDCVIWLSAMDTIHTELSARKGGGQGRRKRSEIIQSLAYLLDASDMLWLKYVDVLTRQFKNENIPLDRIKDRNALCGVAGQTILRQGNPLCDDVEVDDRDEHQRYLDAKASFEKRQKSAEKASRRDKRIADARMADLERTVFTQSGMDKIPKRGTVTELYWPSDMQRPPSMDEQIESVRKRKAVREAKHEQLKLKWAKTRARLRKQGKL